MNVAVALLITLALEVPLVALVYRRQARRMAVAAALVTTLTNLAMNTLLFASVRYSLYIAIGELSTTAVEALAYLRIDRERDLGRALLASALANTASYAAGFLL